MIKTMNLRIWKAQCIPQTINTQKIKTKHIIKLLKTNDKERKLLKQNSTLHTEETFNE